ncbi:DUF1761 domain-containing protein [Paenibacillus sp. Soil724D2]|uniref:DUF1761 domain-containing protein n=1 Tax=Paenibacillus sp. (strain Soil724D2) TaxID=1736392 RepID=UPI000712F1B3|nr:DUF1761 domain-containing protein [Paenibacillus sp. Soil724D2]KRE32959.1 hypothetical protein ASG85_15770 [Paenibacillus sp. Soil724D2]
MLLQGINYWAVLVTGILSLVLGFLWMAVIWKQPYQKRMYGGMDLSKEASSSGKIQSFVIYILVSFITSIAFAACLELWRAGGKAFGYDGNSLSSSFWFTMLLTAGFTLPFTVGKKVWQFKSWLVVAVDTSYEIVRFTMLLLIFWFWK